MLGYARKTHLHTQECGRSAWPLRLSGHARCRTSAVCPLACLNRALEAHLRTHRGSQGASGRWGEPKEYLAPATHARPIPGAISTSEAQLFMPSSAERPKGRQEPKERAQEKEHPVQAPPRAVPGEPSVPLSRRETLPDEATPGSCDCSVCLSVICAANPICACICGV